MTTILELEKEYGAVKVYPSDRPIVEITSEHIVCSVPHDPHHCVVANALRDRFPGAVVNVGAEIIKLAKRNWEAAGIIEIFFYRHTPATKEIAMILDGRIPGAIMPGIYSIRPVKPIQTPCERALSKERTARKKLEFQLAGKPWTAAKRKPNRVSPMASQRKTDTLK